MCVLSLDTSDPTDDTFIVNPARSVGIKILPISGSVTFTANTNVTDSSGAVVAGTTINPDGLSFSFTTRAGGTYELTAIYQCLPRNSMGRLVENCPNGVMLANILSATTSQGFITKA